MNCQEFASIVIEIVREQRPATTHAHALQHTERCASCAARLAQEQALLDDIRLVVEDIAQQSAPAWIEANLLTALREQTEAKRVVAAPIARWWSWQWAAGFAAAALLLLILLASASWQKAEPNILPQEARQSPAPAQPEITVEHAAPRTPEPKVFRAMVRRVQPRRTPRPVVTPPSEQLPFYSLITEGEMAPLESGRVVRIEVPPATLVNLGVPLTETTLTQPVQADLLLGQDGLARAIRFLPPTQTTRSQ